MLKRKSHAVFKTAAVTENVANKSGLVNFTAVEKLYYVYYCYHCLKYEHFLYEVVNNLYTRTCVQKKPHKHFSQGFLSLASVFSLKKTQEENTKSL